MTQRWQRAPLEKNDEHYARERVRVSDDSLPRPGFSAHNEVVLRRAVGPQSIKRRSEQVAAMRKSTAVYFEWLAQKETRDYDRRQRLLEVARFYRSLAGIIPAMPTQYKIQSRTVWQPSILCHIRLHSHCIEHLHDFFSASRGGGPSQERREPRPAQRRRLA